MKAHPHHIAGRIAAIRAKVRTSTANQQRTKRRDRYTIHHTPSGQVIVSDWLTGRTRSLQSGHDLATLGRHPSQSDLARLFD